MKSSPAGTSLSMRAVMTLGTLGILAITPSTARAEAACSLRVLEAPREVSDALLGWAGGEKTCHALDVRITPTGAGYSLWARAEDGRTFTRWVADPKTAALLVVSWAGDDTLPAADPPRSATYTLQTHVRYEVPQAPGPAIASPAPPARSRELAVGMIANPSTGEGVYARTGVRASIDVTTHDAWRVGIAAMLSDEKVNVYDPSRRVAQAYQPRASAIAYISRGIGNDRLRLGAGAGFAYTQLSDVVIEPGEGGVMIERVGIFAPAIELSAIVAIPVTLRWSITGGLVITATGPSSTYKLLDDPYTFASGHDHGSQVVGTIGVARSL